jgi:hypothetical protein
MRDLGVSKSTQQFIDELASAQEPLTGKQRVDMYGAFVGALASELAHLPGGASAWAYALAVAVETVQQPSLMTVRP